MPFTTGPHSTPRRRVNSPRSSALYTYPAVFAQW